MAQTEYFSSSPFKQWIGTNCALLDRERCHLLEFLHGPTEEMAELDEKIAALTRRRKELEQGIKKHKALVHPIRDIPNEVLQTIFLYSLPTKHFPTMSTSEAPLSVTGVCRRWRSVALQTPELWCSLHVVVIPEQSSKEEEVKFHTERVHRWFSAAGLGNMPLSISISSTINHTLRRPIDKAFVNTLLTYSSRFRTLELRTSDELLDAFAFHPCTWPALERVVIDVDDTTSGDVRALNITNNDVTLWKASKLKDVEWRSVDDLFYYVRGPSQWRNMKRIAMSSPHPEFTTSLGFPSCVIRTMLRATQDLIELRIPISGDDDDDSLDWLDTYATFHPAERPPSEPRAVADVLVLKHLTILNLVDAWTTPSITGDAATPFLHNLYLPVLTSLVYSLRQSTDWEQPDIPPPLHDEHPLVLFMRAQPQPNNITSWTVTSGSICPLALLECLKLMPALERLWINTASKPAVTDCDPEDYHSEDLFDLVVDDNLLQSFIRPHDGTELDLTKLRAQVLCPRLHSLRFDKTKLSIMAIHAFLEVRIAYALLSRACLPSSTNGGIALLRRFHVRSDIHRPHLDPFDSLHDPVIQGKRVRCSDKLSVCSLAEDCERLGVDVIYTVPEEGPASSPSRAGEVFNAGKAGSRPSVDPRYGLASSDDDDWV